jgi:hypothetical protein
MVQHKYSAGQSVRYTPDSSIDADAEGDYTIARVLPDTDGVLQYRIKAKIDGRERVVREDQLARAQETAR